MISNLRSDYVRNCEETTTFLEECEKIIIYKKKGIVIRRKEL